MLHHDQLFKQLFESFLDDLLRLVVPWLVPRVRIDRARFLRDELFTDLPQGERRRLDLVAELPGRGEGPELVLVHVEVEAAARRTMGRRMARYAMQLRLRHGRPVVPLVVYLSGGPPGLRETRWREVLWGRELAALTGFELGLRRARAAEYLARPEPLGWALAARMSRGGWSPARLKLECLRRILRAPVDEARRFLLANVVETYVQLAGDEAERFVRIAERELPKEESSMIMTWGDKIREKALREGRREGRAAGRREVLLRILESRFGELSPQARRRVETIAAGRELDRLVDRALAARSLDDLGLG